MTYSTDFSKPKGMDTISDGRKGQLMEVAAANIPIILITILWN
jgi:hypothetical protein